MHKPVRKGCRHPPAHLTTAVRPWYTHVTVRRDPGRTQVAHEQAGLTNRPTSITMTRHVN